MKMLSAEGALERLQPIFAAATRDASAAMCRWTESLISLTCDEIREVPLEQASTVLELDDSPVTAVALDFQGELGGQLLVIFHEADARQLAGTLLGRPLDPASPWSELEKSAVAETGNILGCAYMNALMRVIDEELVPSAPCFVQDYGASVLEQALWAQAGQTDRVLVCRSGFQRHGEDLFWHVVFLPRIGLRQALIGAVGGHALPPNANAQNPA